MRNPNIICHNCGKKGHISRDCWAKPSTSTSSSQSSNWQTGWGNNKGRGKGKGKKGKDAGSLEDAGGEYAEPDGEAASANVFDICGVHDLSAFDLATCESLPLTGKWVALNLDTGAAKTVWPSHFESLGKLIPNDKGGENPRFRTATGEIVDGGNRREIRAVSEFGAKFRLKGHTAPVHKPLLAAGESTDAGNDVWLSGDTGYNSEGFGVPTSGSSGIEGNCV